MKPELPMDPRTDLEARVVALLLGEASPFEEAQLLRIIEQDPELAAFYRDMQKTVGLLREIARPQSLTEQPAPKASTAASASSPKLSPTRRAALLAALQTPPASAPTPAPRHTAPARQASLPPSNRVRGIWHRMRQPIGPSLHWAIKLAAVVALLALLGSLLMPALSPVKLRSSRVAELNRQKMAELEKRLAEESGKEDEAFAPSPGAQPDALQERRRTLAGAVVSQTAAPPTDAPASARFAQNIYLPPATAEAPLPAKPGDMDRDKTLGDKLVVLTDESFVNTPPPPTFHDTYGVSSWGDEGFGGRLGRPVNSPAPGPSTPAPATRDLKDATKIESVNGLAAANRLAGPPAATPAPPAETPISQLTGLGLAGGQALGNGRADGSVNLGMALDSVDNLQRQSVRNEDWITNLPQQNFAYGTVNLGKSQAEATEQFWKESPSLGFTPNANVAEAAGRLSREPESAGVQLQEFRSYYRAPTASETTLKRLSEQDGTRELERLARQSVQMPQPSGLKSAAGGVGAATPPSSTPPPARKLEESAAPAEKEVLLERLEAAKKPASGAEAKSTPVPMAPPPPVAAIKAAGDETSDKRKAGASLPPLIHPMEVQTAPNSVVNFSTFSLNVSDVSFKTAAASLQAGQWPDPNSIRVEEFINALNYRDPAPAPGARVAFNWEIARHPFAHQRDLLRFSIQTAALGRQAAQPLNLVVLLDNSGSMGRPDRVAIVSQALQVLAGKLHPQDKISVVAFARRAQLCVDGQPGQRAKEAIQQVLRLNPEGGTDLGAGLDLAYQTALKHFHPGANNRVLLLTDGAANLGDVDPEILRQKVIQHRQRGVALDCFGVGWEGLDDDLLEVLSRNGDGRYALLNDVEQAAAEFAEKLAGALNVAAADVKTQVEFNPYRVTAYRQMGYARHQLTKEQFRDNTVDAAELAAAEAGHAMYAVQVNAQGSGPLGVVRVRYRVPATGQYEEREWILPYTPQPPPLAQASPAMRLAASAALLGEFLSRNPYAGEIQLKALAAIAGSAVKAFEPDPRPQQLLSMLQQAMRLEGVQ
jgi:Mg-chelatase subunit ChlD